jgi:hypothetical protein
MASIDAATRFGARRAAPYQAHDRISWSRRDVADDRFGDDPALRPLLRHGWSNLPSALRTLATRPFHKSGAGCTACPRFRRSGRPAVSSSYAIEQTPTSRCICRGAPTTDARAIPPALPSPARAVVLGPRDAALSELVQPERDVRHWRRCCSACDCGYDRAGQITVLHMRGGPRSREVCA